MSEQTDKRTKQVIETLTRLGISKVVIEFDGGGDNGQMQDISYESALHDDPKFLRNQRCPPEIDWAKPGMGEWDRESRQYVNKPTYANVEDMLDTWAYDALDVLEFDWVNNDGGYGTITILPAEGVIHIESHRRFTDTEQLDYDLGDRTWDEYQDQGNAHALTEPGNEEAA